MPFGKHKGLTFDQIPEDYLVWLLENVELYEPLLGRVLTELERRRGGGQREEEPRKRGPRSDPPDPGVVVELITSGHRALARRAHPDMGGTHEAMLKVQAAAEWLFGQARKLVN